jgi:crotonobetainyl-CoA:carnitine CoA-transferase CaiB-like acyl-CoA transferase
MKLRGLKVIDLSQFLPGPVLTLMLADQGADVLKVEPPSGDPARAMAPFENGQSVWFRNVNRGKRSVTLDLKSEAGKAALLALCDDADVFVESFRPGVISRLGFGYEALKARNPRLVYCSISAFGQSGSHAGHPAHDMAVQALTGFLSVNDGPDGTPVVPGVPAADMAVALTGLSAVLMALIGRASSGQGDYIDCAMADSLLPWCSHMAGPALVGGDAPRSATQRSLGGAAFYNVYETADGKFIVLAGREIKFVRNLMTALGRPDLAAVGEADAGPAQHPLKAFLSDTFKQKTRDEWVHWFHDKDVAFAPVLDFKEVFASDLVAERGLLVESHGRQIAPAIRFASQMGRDLPDAPRLASP